MWSNVDEEACWCGFEETSDSVVNVIDSGGASFWGEVCILVLQT